MHETPIRCEPISVTIARLERLVARMESRYECSSFEMEKMLVDGKFHETREVGKWLMEAQVLKNLRDAVGSAAG